MHTDRHFLKMVKSCSGHFKTCKCIKNTRSQKFSAIQCFFLVYVEESKNATCNAIYQLICIKIEYTCYFISILPIKFCANLNYRTRDIRLQMFRNLRKYDILAPPVSQLESKLNQHIFLKYACYLLSLVQFCALKPKM